VKSCVFGEIETITTLTSADLKDNLHSIQDNVVTPILGRDRHIFLKFLMAPKRVGSCAIWTSASAGKTQRST